MLMEQVRVLAEQGELRFEEVTAVLGIGYVALEVRDLEQASDFFQRGRDTAIRYELAALETSANCGYAEVLLWTGQWSKAEDLATELLSTDADDSRLHAIIGTLSTRSGRDGGLEHLERSWSGAARRGTDFLLRSATALAERSWLLGDVDRSLVDGFADVLELGLANGFPWPAGSLAFWLSQLGVITEVPPGVPQPFAAVLHGDFREAAAFWEARRAPYERALALLAGDPASRLDALEVFETLGATAVAAKVRKDLKADGVPVTRGRGQATRSNTSRTDRPAVRDPPTARRIADERSDRRSTLRLAADRRTPRVGIANKARSVFPSRSSPPRTHRRTAHDLINDWRAGRSQRHADLAHHPTSSRPNHSNRTPHRRSPPEAQIGMSLRASRRSTRRG